MKKILFLLLPLIPALALAQTGTVKDSVRVLTIAQIPAGAIRDTTNFTFVQDNAFRKATFDSLYKYTRVKLLAAGGITSAELAGALSNKTGTGAAVFGTSPVLTTPNLGTPSAATLTNATGLPIATGLTGLGGANHIPYATSATALATDTGLVYIPSSKNFGIGLSNPSRKLHVVNNTPGGVVMTLQSNILRSDGTSSYAFQLKSEGITGSSYAFRALNISESKIYLTIQTDSLNQVNGDRQGFVGIGTDAPTQVLHVVGNARITGLGGAGTLDVQADANGVLVRASSLELKENIEQLPYGLREIMQLYPVRFNYKNREKWGDGKDIGFIAEDVLQVTSEAVGISSEGELYLNNSRIIPTLVKAIQEQQGQIEQLKQRITQLENK